VTIISYNITTPQGRAIQHVLDNTVLVQQQIAGGLTVSVGVSGGRTVTSHRAFEDVLSGGEAGLLLLIRSLAGQDGHLNLWFLFDSLDEAHRLVVAQAVWMAAGYDIAAVAAS
jgi:hypothetical protein